MAALENQLEACEREVTQLKLALERSDAHIEELEKKLSAVGLNQNNVNSENESIHGHLADQFLFNDYTLDSSLNSAIEVPMARRYKATFSDRNRHYAAKKIKKEENSLSTHIDFPSPMLSAISASSSMALLDDNSHMSLTTKRNLSTELNYGDSDDSDKKAVKSTHLACNELELPSPLPKLSNVKFNACGQECTTIPTKKVEKMVTYRLSTQDCEPARDRKLYALDKQYPSKISGNLFECLSVEADISMTPELKDCLRIFDEAERKVGQMHQFLSSTVDQK